MLLEVSVGKYKFSWGQWLRWNSFRLVMNSVEADHREICQHIIYTLFKATVCKALSLLFF
jgi:hypothetical protein